MVLTDRLRPPRGRPVHTVRVRVKGGYQPAVVHGRVGEPLRILFSREESASCSEHVVFPAFGRSAMLPAFEDVSLELVPERAGEYEFTCQLGMLRGRLVVAGDDVERPVSRARVRSASPQPARGIENPPGDIVLLAFAAWICSLPLLLLLAVPFLGWRAGGVLALLWLSVVAGACLAVCARRVRRPNVRSAPRSEGRCAGGDPESRYSDRIVTTARDGRAGGSTEELHK